MIHPVPPGSVRSSSAGRVTLQGGHVCHAWHEEKRRKSLVNDHILTYLWEKIWLFTRIYGLFISYPHFMRIEP